MPIDKDRMRHLLMVCALASLAGTARAQQPDGTPRPTSTLTAAADSVGMPLPPDCVRTGKAQDVATGDSLCLTRQEAIAAALQRNPQLRAVAEQVAQARARLVQGTAIPDPQFSAEIDNATSLFGGEASDKILTASLTIPFPDKFRLRNRIGQADVRSNEANLELLRQLIASQTSQTYDSLLTAIRHRRNLEDAKTLADAFLARTESRFQAGTVPRLDVVRAQVDAAGAQNDLIASEREVAIARTALNRLIDRPLGAPVAAADSLQVPPELPPIETLEAAALAARPELAGLDRQLEGARATTALAKEFWLPDVAVGVMHNYASPGPGNLFAGFYMPIPIFYWNHDKGEIAESRHVVAELEASRRDLGAGVDQDVRVAYAAAATALRQAVFLRDVLVPAAREAYRIASVTYDLGGSSSLEVLDARRALRDAENQYTDALAAANMSRADLGRAVAVSLSSFQAGGPSQ
jgi:cobalt-zinc-cadmium efflux system outer membrane protein